MEEPPFSFYNFIKCNNKEILILSIHGYRPLNS
ncbi:MAG: hypothetical protein K0R05_4801 [Anaerocolumna sp.]|jgi:hypothetical protein|nr:hypothetical protein [Anaerocolumna sp.]